MFYYYNCIIIIIINRSQMIENKQQIIKIKLRCSVCVCVCVCCGGVDGVENLIIKWGLPWLQVTPSPRIFCEIFVRSLIHKCQPR